jgi:hypothetical protein
MIKILLLFVYLNVAVAGYGQLFRLEGKETVNNAIRFGIKLGLSISKTHIRYDPNFYPGEDDVARVGVIGGGMGVIRINKKVVFQPEILIVGKGAKERRQDYDFVKGLTYLELPLNLLYKPATTKGSFFIGGGPAPSFLIGDNIFYTGYESFNKFDFGVNVIMGYELPIGLSFNLQYTYGLLNISNDKSTLPVVKNRCFGLTAGYLF